MRDEVEIPFGLPGSFESLPAEDRFVRLPDLTEALESLASEWEKKADAVESTFRRGTEARRHAELEASSLREFASDLRNLLTDLSEGTSE